MKATSNQPPDFSTYTPEEFHALFEFVGKCDFTSSDSITDPVKLAFVAILLASFKQWQERTGSDADVIQSVQYALRFEQLRKELAAVLFHHGPPTESQLETTFGLLFQVAYIRQQLVGNGKAKVANSP
jgi:hypothetical protein